MKKVNKFTMTFLAVAVIALFGFGNSVQAEGGHCRGNCDPDPIPVPVSVDEMILTMQKEFTKKLLAPTDLNVDPNASYNLAGLQTFVAPLERTKLVNKLNSDNFNNDDVGAIALNNSVERTLAATEFIPLGAAYQIDNTGADNAGFDFVISSPIVE